MKKTWVRMRSMAMSPVKLVGRGKIGGWEYAPNVSIKGVLFTTIMNREEKR